MAQRNAERTRTKNRGTFSSSSAFLGFPRRTVPAFAFLFFALSPLVSAQDAPEGPVPGFALIGSVTQKVAPNAPDWATAPVTAWAFTTDLSPKFTFGPVVFTASSTWTLPITANLTAGTPTVVVPEAYFRISPTPSLDLTFGQKRFNLGVGQTFTVGDSLNPVIGFFDQKTGFRGATAEWSPVSWASASAAVSTEGGTAASPVTAAGQAAFLFDKLQLTASVVGARDRTFNPSLGASYDLAGVIVTAEGAAEFLPQGKRPSGPVATWSAPDAWTSPALSASAGARWTVTLFDIDWTVSGEYLHWGQGWTSDETDTWKAAWAQAAGPAKAPLQGLRMALPLRSRENAFFRFSAVSGTEFSAAAFAAVDLQDQSVLSQETVTWTPWDNLDLTATLQAVSGQSGTSWEFLNPNKDRYQASLATTYHF
jgi:hypothetical protein